MSFHPSLAAAVLLACLAPCHAQTVVVDFDPLSGAGAHPSPYAEDGVVVQSMFDNGQDTSFNLRLPDKAMRCGGGSFGLKYRVSLPGGLAFKMVSLRISPYLIAGTTVFTGRKANNVTVTQSFGTGTNAAGTLCVFPPSFEDIVALEWSATSALSTASHVDDITVELPSRIIVPSAVTVTEGAGTADFGVSFDPPLTRPASLAWEAVPATATHPADYGFGGPTTGTVVVPAGSSGWSMPGTIVGDALTESVESFSLVFSSTSAHVHFPTNHSTTVSIGNDDGVTGFPGWMSGHGLAGNDALPDADPDGNGISNIECWLFRLNPAGASPLSWQERRASFLFDVQSRPAIRFTVPAPLPTDVRMIFEECLDPALPWSEQARRTGFGTGSLWTGSGSGRVSEVNNGAVSRTVTCPGASGSSRRTRTFLRMKYEYVAGSGGAS